MVYRLPDGKIINAPARGKSFTIDDTRHPEVNILVWEKQGVLDAYGIVKVPLPVEEVAEEVKEAWDKETRKQLRHDVLRGSLLESTEMIIALFQIGRQKGLWSAEDFPLDLRNKVQEWQKVIADEKADV